jgi:hypothetical protein
VNILPSFLRAAVSRWFTVNIYLTTSCCCFKMIYSEHLFDYFVLLFQDDLQWTFYLLFMFCGLKMIYSEHLFNFFVLLFQDDLQWTFFLLFFVLLFQDDLQWTFIWLPSCCCFKMIYSEHLFKLNTFVKFSLLFFSSLFINYCTCTFVLLFQDDLPLNNVTYWHCAASKRSNFPNHAHLFKDAP